MDVAIVITGAAEWERRLARAKRVANYLIEKNLRALGIVIAAKERRVLEVVKFRGSLARSVNSELTIAPPNFVLRIGPTAPHAQIVRTGTRPHWAPIAPLKEWAKWKLGDENAAYAIQRSIAYYGTSRWLAKRGVPFAEQTQYGIGLDYPAATLARADVKQGIERTAQRIGAGLAVSLESREVPT